MNDSSLDQYSRQVLEEAKKLYDFGLAIHWIRPNTKIPVNRGWNRTQRQSWAELIREFRKGYGVGILLGNASRVNGGYLAVVDVDVRSENPRYLEEALDAVFSRFPQLRDAPSVLTGRGNGSRHIYFLTPEPLQSQKLEASTDLVEVFSPSTPISKSQTAKFMANGLSEMSIEDGWRMKKATECELMSDGKQVVAPPTLHPDTRRPYRWKKEWK